MTAPGARGTADPGRPLVIGIGNEHRGDDAAGLWVARRLRPRLEGRGEVLELSSEGTRLLDAWDGAGLVVVVDAVTSGRPVGTIHRMEVGPGPLPASLAATSTHGISLAQAVALGQALGRLPRRLLIFGLEGTRFAAGDELSPELRPAIEAVSAEVEALVRSNARANPRAEARADA